MDIRFEWDAAKAEANVRKHGVSFELARRAILDPFAIVEQDRIVDGERRWQTLGMAGGVLLLLVAHTVADWGEDGELVRIISARKADRSEWRRYESEKR